MRRDQFEHVIAAAAEVCGEWEIVVIGSQAILGNVDEPPESMGSLGDGSHFQSQFGYYAHGVGPETAVAPAGWEDRLVRVDIPPRPGQSEGPVALCVEIHDLMLAKCAAGRDHDWRFVHDALAAELVQVEELHRRLQDLPEPPVDREHVRKMLEGIVARTR